jgi:hypothetical protein
LNKELKNNSGSYCCNNLMSIMDLTVASVEVDRSAYYIDLNGDTVEIIRECGYNFYLIQKEAVLRKLPTTTIFIVIKIKLLLVISMQMAI